MARDMFGDVTKPAIAIGSRAWYTVPVSLTSHALVVIGVIALPILGPALLPQPFTAMEGYIGIVPTPPAPPPPRRATETPPVQPGNPNAAPIEAPRGIAPEPQIEPGFENADAGGLPIVGDFTPRLLEPPPAVVEPPAPVRVGGQIRPPTKIHETPLIYPAIAQAARVQGMVIIEATIGADGVVMNAKVLRSIPLLDQAALDAVRQWQYTPTLLNGVPVPVIMTVVVQFKLQ